MKNPKKYLTFTLIVAVVIAAGLLTGRQLSNIKYPTPEKIFARLAKKSDYMAAIPSSGPIVQIQTIEVDYDDEFDLAVGLLTHNEAEKIQVGHDVVLYDQEGHTLPLGGSVNSITNNAQNSDIEIYLPEGTNTDLLLNHLNIITDIIPAGQRIPKNAVFIDKDANYYVWVATPLKTLPEDEKNMFLVSKRPTNKGPADQEYISVDVKLDFEELVIVNPDEKLKENKKYKIFTVVLDAISQHPTQQAYSDYVSHRYNELYAELEQAHQDCLAGKTVADPNAAPRGSATLPDGSTINSCGTRDDGTPPTPEEILNLILNAGQTNYEQSSEGCAAGACAQ